MTGADAGLLPAVDAAPLLSDYLGCEVTRCPGRPGRVEARGLPGVHVMIGRPREVAAEGREVLMRSWLRVLGTLARLFACAYRGEDPEPRHAEHEALLVQDR